MHLIVVPCSLNCYFNVRILCRPVALFKFRVRISGFGFRVWVFGFRVSDLGFGAWGLKMKFGVGFIGDPFPVSTDSFRFSLGVGFRVTLFRCIQV